MTEPLKQAPRVRSVPPARTQEAVRVIYGVHSIEANIAGRSVGEIRTALKQALNIGPQAVAVVDGREILESYMLQAGQVLEFVRLAGEKGAEVRSFARIPGDGGRPGVPGPLGRRTGRKLDHLKGEEGEAVYSTCQPPEVW